MMWDTFYSHSAYIQKNIGNMSSTSPEPRLSESDFRAFQKNLIAKIYIPGPWWLEDFFTQQ